MLKSRSCGLDMAATAALTAVPPPEAKLNSANFPHQSDIHGHPHLYSLPLDLPQPSSSESGRSTSSRAGQDSRDCPIDSLLPSVRPDSLTEEKHTKMKAQIDSVRPTVDLNLLQLESNAALSPASEASSSSPIVNTPRATSPSRLAAEGAPASQLPRSPSSKGKERAIEGQGPVEPVLSQSATDLALQVQSAVSRKVTQPLLDELEKHQHSVNHPATDQSGDDSGSTIAENQSDPVPEHGDAERPQDVDACQWVSPASTTCASPQFTSAVGSPARSEDHFELAQDHQPFSLTGPGTDTFSEASNVTIDPSTLQVADADLIEAGGPISSSAGLSGADEEKEPGSDLRIEVRGNDMIRKDSNEPVSATQTDISRTPSTSTTGSSHAGSLDTAISSVQSAADSASVFPDQSADTLKLTVNNDKGQADVPAEPPMSFTSEPETLPEALVATLEDSFGQPASADRVSPEERSIQGRIRRYAALMELIDTERNYADDLATLVLVFFDNLCTMPFFEDQPARQALVMRNSEDLLRLHQKISAKLDGILSDLKLRRRSGSLSVSDQQWELERALSPEADEAVSRVAKLFISMMPKLQSYQAFCSRHGEALALIREAEKRSTDWEAYERRCADILRISRTPTRSSTGMASGGTTPNPGNSSPISYFSPAVSAPSSAVTTPVLAPSASRQNSSRLLFRDFLIKPIQRLCLYPLVLQTLLKHTGPSARGAQELSEAITMMREVADQVDEAGKQRELELMADLVVSRVEPQQGVTPAFLKTLGHCRLAGALDVLYHERLTAPLVAPLRFKYSGVFLYQDFILFVKVRKGPTYECRYWFPLWAAKLSKVDDSNNLLPHAFRLSVKDHHFEVAAANARERQLWIDALTSSISVASFSPPGEEAAFPSSLYLGDLEDLDTVNSEGATPSATRYAEAKSYFDLAARDSDNDPLMEFFAMHAAGALQSSAVASKGQRTSSSSSPWLPTEILLRHASPSSRSNVDRGMVFSDSILNARSSREAGDLSSLWLPHNASLGSAVGSAMGISRLSAKDTSTVKIQRRKSCAGLLENHETVEDENGQLVFTATLLQPLSRSRASTRSQADAVGDRDTWKASLKKKAAKVRPSSIFAPGLTITTDNLASPRSVLSMSSSSTPTSPIQGSRELPTLEFGMLSPTSSTSGGARFGPEDFPPSVTSSPRSRTGSALNSAHSSSVNLKASFLQATRRSSIYGVKESLTASFSRRGRSHSSQTDTTDLSDFLSSSRGVSPMASSAVLPLDSQSSSPTATDEVLAAVAEHDSSSRPSSRASSRAGSLRRALTSGPTFKSRRRAQSLAAVTAEAKLTPLSSLPSPDSANASIPVNGLGAESSRVRPRRGSVKTYGPDKPLGNSLRRSRTMLSAGRAWLSSSTPEPSTSVDRVHAEADSSLSSKAGARPATAGGGEGATLRSGAFPTPSVGSIKRFGTWRRSSQPGPQSEDMISRSERRRNVRSESLPVVTQPVNPSESPRRGSKVFNTLRFLQSNRLSPMPAVDQTPASASSKASKTRARQSLSSLSATFSRPETEASASVSGNK